MVAIVLFKLAGGSARQAFNTLHPIPLSRITASSCSSLCPFGRCCVKCARHGGRRPLSHQYFCRRSHWQPNQTRCNRDGQPSENSKIEPKREKATSKGRGESPRTSVRSKLVAYVMPQSDILSVLHCSVCAADGRVNGNGSNSNVIYHHKCRHPSLARNSDVCTTRTKVKSRESWPLQLSTSKLQKKPVQICADNFFRRTQASNVGSTVSDNQQQTSERADSASSLEQMTAQIAQSLPDLFQSVT